ncbi:hypothetical protein [Micromonospora sp. KC721]|uniref:hypothetical protein n=1 Tax=Micromonospora sp. KC721 TaxID=2530380 RepID=UPI0010491E85|nr:hypothetical protein [Micromonospora sp. KC721]TDB81871.1 hypothetical protein E1182_03490 [Micromonospora sp. KC721]
MAEINYGIQQSGGTSQVGNQAVGPGASATGGSLHATAPPAVDVAGLLRQLTEVVDRHRGALPEPAVTVAAQVRAELSRPEPRPARVAELLRRLAELAAPVAPVAAAVTEVIRAVQSV